MIRALKTVAEVRAWRGERAGEPVAFVPTMGALHAGHLSLVGVARARAPRVLASVFVNPTQFNDPKDFERYPVDIEGDLAALERAGCDACFVPSVEVMYPPGAQARVRVGSLANHLCGAARPGHFEGVCTVVASLFNITRCEVAVFGEKDFQQLAIIRQMVRDLSFPVEVVGVPTAREADGLAMSSRNLRLSPEHRAVASGVYAGLSAARAAWAAGVREVGALRAVALARFPVEGRVDYLEVCDVVTLAPFEGVVGAGGERALMAVAVFLGEVRLIDNVVLGG